MPFITQSTHTHSSDLGRTKEDHAFFIIIEENPWLIDQAPLRLKERVKRGKCCVLVRVAAQSCAAHKSGLFCRCLMFTVFLYHYITCTCWEDGMGGCGFCYNHNILHLSQHLLHALVCPFTLCPKATFVSKPVYLYISLRVFKTWQLCWSCSVSSL